MKSFTFRPQPKALWHAIALTALTAGAVFAVSSERVAHPTPVVDPAQIINQSQIVDPVSLVQSEAQPRIQVAILLDTSGSMDGLIDQTRNQLWQMVNEFATAKHQGKTPILEVAVFEYGNSGLSAQSGYIRQVTGLTRELDRVSEALFSLTTNGGDEYCGAVIQSAVRDLDWSQQAQDIRTIFIAGNEPFTQGPVSFKEAIAFARQKDIRVNTIFAGNYDTGNNSGWAQGAQLAGGNYMNIDQNHQVVHVVAPQDKKIADLNAQLNQTYLPYGDSGKVAAKRQREQDEKSSEYSLGLLAERVKSKISSVYNNAKWDLLDAMESGDVELEALDDAALPAPMVGMSVEQKKDYVAQQKQERVRLQEEIQTLTEEREAYVAKEVASQPAEAPATVSDAMSASIRAEAKKKAYVFE